MPNMTYSQPDAITDYNLGVGAFVSYVIFKSIAIPSSGDATGIRTLALINQQGGVDDNSLIIYECNAIDGWSLVSDSADLSVASLLTEVKSLPPVGLYISASQDSFDELNNYMITQI